MGLLDGKVFAITGAGGGLGQAHARAMAEAGAKLVVNDYGTTVHGEEGEQDPAAELAESLEATGAAVVVNRASVADPEGAESIVADALESFGRLDGVINNAGILRDKTIVKMTDEMWRAVLGVHLDGTFYVMRAAMRHFEERGDDGVGKRIINTSSIAGLQGNFGQANYGAAKAGIAGLTRVAALEARRSGTTVNAIAPVAKTRMTDDVDGVSEDLAPKKVSPLVVWLASEEADEVTGRIFGAHGDHYFEYRMETTAGVELDSGWRAVDVGEKFEAITRVDSTDGNGGGPEGEVVEEVEALLRALTGELHDHSWEATLQFDVGQAGSWSLVIGGGEATLSEGPAEDATATIEFSDAATLLAIARGEQSAEKAFMAGDIESDNMQTLMKFGEAFDLQAAASVLEESGGSGASGGSDGEASGDSAEGGLNREMVGKVHRGRARFVRPEEIEAYAEATSNDNPRHVAGTDAARERGGPIAPPLFPVRPMHRVLEEVLTDDALNADLLRLVHGEQDMRMYAPLESWDLVAPRAEIAGIEDKSSGQLLRVHLWLMREGEKVCDADSVMFIRSGESAGGGSGDKRGRRQEREDGRSDGEVVHRSREVVGDDQPQRYAEASGDHNPIHTDPEVAKAAGLPGVILHGLCTMAFASNAVVEGVCGGDPTRLRRLKTRFSKPVRPGEQVETAIWSASDETPMVEGVSMENVYNFVTTNDDGWVVLSRGRAEVRE